MAKFTTDATGTTWWPNLRLMQIHNFSEESKGYFTKLLFFGVNCHVIVFDQNSGGIEKSRGFWVEGRDFLIPPKFHQSFPWKLGNISILAVYFKFLWLFVVQLLDMYQDCLASVQTMRQVKSFIFVPISTEISLACFLHRSAGKVLTPVQAPNVLFKISG